MTNSVTLNGFNTFVGSRVTYKSLAGKDIIASIDAISQDKKFCYLTNGQKVASSKLTYTIQT